MESDVQLHNGIRTTYARGRVWVRYVVVGTKIRSRDTEVGKGATMSYQVSIFDGEQPFKIDKPIRLITLFSGYDSQALALKYLGVPFEHYRTCEWAIPSIQALHDLHFAEDTTDYSDGMSTDELAHELARLGISADYNQPLEEQSIRRRGEKSCDGYITISSPHAIWYQS